MRNLGLLVLILCGNVLLGQDQEKKYLINLGGGIASAGDVSLHSLGGRMGKIINGKYALGLDGGFTRIRVGSDDWQVSDIGPFFRYYYFENNMGAFFGAQGSYAVSKEINRNLGGASSEKYPTVLFGPEMGIDIFLAESAALEVLVHYQFDQPTNEYAKVGTAVVVKVGVTVFL